MDSGAGSPPPGRTPKLRDRWCPARPAPYLAGAVLRRRRRRRGGWAAQSHIVPGRGGRSQLRVTSAANNEGFDRRGARPARSPAPRPPPPPARPARPLPAPSPDPITARRARPSRPSAAAARPAPRAAVRPERRPLPGGLARPSPGSSSSPREWGARGGSGLKRGPGHGSARAAPRSQSLRSRPAGPSVPSPLHPHLGLCPAPARIPRSSGFDPLRGRVSGAPGFCAIHPRAGLSPTTKPHTPQAPPASARPGPRASRTGSRTSWRRGLRAV